MGAGLRKLVFQPPAPTYGDDPNLVWLTTSKREVIPAFHVFRSASKLTLIFSHGNAEDLGMIVNYFKELSQIWDVNIFAYEYAGYGMSSGTPSEENVYADVEAAYNYLTQKFKIPWWKIVLYGRSLETGASVHLASKRPVRGMILQSGLLSIHRVGLNLRMTLPGDMFCNIDKIHKVTCPVFIIHGVKDEIVPFSHGMQLYNACPTAVTPYWIEGAGHNNVELTGEVEFIENITRFLKFLGDSPSDNSHEVLELYKDHDKFLRYAIGTSSALPCPGNSDGRPAKAKSTPLQKDAETYRIPSYPSPSPEHARRHPHGAGPSDSRRHRVRSSTPRTKDQALSPPGRADDGSRGRSRLSIVSPSADGPACSPASPRHSRRLNSKHARLDRAIRDRSDQSGDLDLSPVKAGRPKQTDRTKSIDSWYLRPSGKDHELLGHMKRHSYFWERDRSTALPSVAADVSPRKRKDIRVHHALSNHLKQPVDVPRRNLSSIPQAPPASQSSPRKEATYSRLNASRRAALDQPSLRPIPPQSAEATPPRRMRVHVPSLSPNPPYTVPQPPSHKETPRVRHHSKLKGCIPRKDSGDFRDAVSTSAESTKPSSPRGRHHSPRIYHDNAARTVRCI